MKYPLTKAQAVTFKGLTYVRTLEYLTGNMLTEWTNEGETYLQKWVDQDTLGSRYLMVKASKEDVAAYLNQTKTLIEIMTSTEAGVAYLVDYSVFHSQAQVYQVNIAELPHWYIPAFLSFHDESLKP
jgi:hypothetical protein